MSKATRSSSRPNSRSTRTVGHLEGDAKQRQALGADVRSIRRTHTGERILELKRDKERKGTAYKSLVEEVLGEGIEVRALTAEAALKVKKLDEVTKVEGLVTTRRRQKGTEGAGRDTDCLGSATCDGRKKVR